MKTTALAAATLLVFGAAAPVVAQDEAPTTEAKAEALTIDNSIKELMANNATAAIIQKHLPGIDQHPAYGQFKTMSLIALQPWSAGAVTDEIIAAVKADLAALNA